MVAKPRLYRRSRHSRRKWRDHIINFERRRAAARSHDDDRQLSIYGPKPDLFPCGSDFLEAAEAEYRANGTYSQTGFSAGGETGVGGLKLNNVAMYFEPELDLIGRSKYAYRISSADLCLYTQQNNWMRTRNPARPHDELVVHQDLLFAGNMLATRLRNQAVYQIT